MTEDQFHEILGLVRSDIEKHDTTMREGICVCREKVFIVHGGH
jgi:hypothetical protein